MKRLIPNYLFNPSTRQITFMDYPSGINLERVLIITNGKTGEILYNFVNPEKGGTVSLNILILEVDTTTMLSTDPLLIYYDDPLLSEPGLAGENGEFNALTTSEKYVPVNVTSWWNGYIFCQGTRRFGGLSVNKAGSAGVLIKLYNDYKTSPTNLKATIDATAVKEHNWHGAIFSLGLWAVIADPGGGTAPDVTFFIK